MKRRLMVISLAVTFLLSAAIPVYAADFSDVPSNHPYKEAIDYCQENGFVTGYSATLFGPDDTVTRGQFATMWGRTMQLRTPDFDDIIKPRNYFEGHVFTLYSLGIINGMTDADFDAAGKLNREQLAAFPVRTYELDALHNSDYTAYSDHASISPWAREYISACLNADVFRGLFSTATSLNPQKDVTRAEICKLIYNLMNPETTATVSSINIASMSGGTVKASKTKAAAGTTITLTVTPDTGKQLKDGTLKANNIVVTDNKFTMPEEDVTITAEFEDIPATGEQTIGEITDPWQYFRRG